ncbi:hypothetical protein H0H87_003651 [Tephrocybe sp. NHM501043]|nr:hypothetical protein H0H87_003651 [Tephrocybe sp. NHM501043]
MTKIGTFWILSRCDVRRGWADTTAVSQRQGKKDQEERRWSSEGGEAGECSGMIEGCAGDDVVARAGDTNHPSLLSPPSAHAVARNDDDPLRSWMDALRQSHSTPLSSRSPTTLTNDDIEAVIQMATSSRASPDGRSGPIKDTRTQLFVGNLPYRVRWQDLKDLFRRAGTVLRADVSLGPDNRSRGYGTVLLATAEDAGRAIDLFNGYSWQTRILEVRPDRLPPDYDANHPPAIVTAPHEDDHLEYSALLDLHHNHPASLSLRSLFVGNVGVVQSLWFNLADLALQLPFHCQWQDLKDLFRQAGAVMRADVALGQDGRSRGFGTVTFATEGDADRAVLMFNGYEYNGRTLKVNHDKFTQLAQPSLGPSSIGTPSSSVSPASISPAPSIRSAPDSRLPLSSSYQTRQLSSLTQSGKLPIGYHLVLGSTSSSPAPLDVWQQQEKAREERDRERERDLLRSFSASSGGAPSTSAPGAQSRLQTHRSPPRHPGPIALPPPPAVTSFAHPHSQPNTSPNAYGIPGFSPLHHPHSPIYHPVSHHQQQAEHIKQLQQQQQQQYQVTPLGLPPMTPSMPPFTFLPPGSPSTSGAGTVGHPYSPYGHPPALPSPMQIPHLMMMHPNAPSGSPLHHPMQHPPPPPAHPPPPHHPSPFGLTPLSPPGSATVPTFAASAAAHYTPLSNFSPGVTMSPGAFWGRPGGPNPLINPAVGAPVHASEPTGYFDGVWHPNSSGAVGGGGSGSGSGSQLANEILKNGDRDGGEVLDGASGLGRKEDGEDGGGRDADGEDKQANGDGDGGCAADKKPGTARARRHSSTATTPWKSHPGAPEVDFRAACHARNSDAEPGPVDLNFELAALVDGGFAISRTHSMSTKKKPAEMSMHLDGGGEVVDDGKGPVGSETVAAA